jgi:molecular chaperone DnaK
LGGEDLNRALVEYFIERWDLPTLDLLGRARLEELAERVKVQLSMAGSVEVALPFGGEQVEPFVLTREEFEVVARPVLRRLREPCLRALHDAKLTPDELEQVILVGGSTRIPAVRALASELFGKEPNTTQHPDEAIGLGATIQAALLDGQISEMGLLDVTPLSLGIETYGGLMNVLIPRNTTIPCKAGEMFTNASASQTSMRIRVLQGEREMARDNWPLGEFSLGFPPVPRGQARVGVQFSIDANGILQVLARDIATGAEKVVELEAAVRVEEDRVEEMVSSSVEQAFADMNARVFTEASIKAQELLGAVGVALEQLNDSLTAEEKAEIEAAVAQVRSAQAGEVARELKQAVERLYELTTPLADRLLEKLLGEE